LSDLGWGVRSQGKRLRERESCESKPETQPYARVVVKVEDWVGVVSPEDL
jgi:hypothetical protein